MFTYMLDQPRRPIAQALQATVIHASLIAGAIVATKSVPAIIPHTGIQIPLVWQPQPVPRAATGCACVVAIPNGVGRVPDVPEIPRVPSISITAPVDPRSVIDDGRLPGFAALAADSLAPAAVLTESEVDEPPTLVAAGPLRYPAILDATHMEGSVTLSFVIDPAGGVEPASVTLISATHPGFVPAAEEAVRTSRFRPAIKAHRPVRVRVRQVITFRQ